MKTVLPEIVVARVRKAVKHRPHKTKEGYDDKDMDLAYRVGYGHAMLYILGEMEKAKDVGKTSPK